MNIISLLFWGFAATVVLTTFIAIAKHLGFTRIDLPFMLGTLFTKSRDKAVRVGFLVHFVLGWFFAFIYGAAFETSGLQNWWFGLVIGFVHAAFILSVGMQMLNSLHPRMARPYQGPTPTRQLQPPGFFALNYGKGTPLATFIAHLAYGIVLGVFYNG
jgi:uncharacterized membrane protein YagU involved in acid resistance